MKNKKLHIALFLFFLLISCSENAIVNTTDSSSSSVLANSSSSSLIIKSSSSLNYSSSSSYEILSEIELRKLMMYENTEAAINITETTTDVNTYYPWIFATPEGVSPHDIIAVMDVTSDISYMGLEDAINVSSEYSYRDAPKQIFDYIGHGNFPKLMLNHGYEIYPDTIKVGISTTVDAIEIDFIDMASAFIRLDISEYPEFDSLGVSIDDLNAGKYISKNLRDSTPYTGYFIDYEYPNNPHWVGLIKTGFNRNLYISYTAAQREENLYVAVSYFDKSFCENQNFLECDGMTFAECVEIERYNCSWIFSAYIEELQENHTKTLLHDSPEE